MSRKIMLVDDDEDLVLALTTRLEAHGYRVVSASNGVEALPVVRQEKPDLMILDILMPEMDGVDLSETLRQDPETRDLPVLFLTALHRREDDHKGGVGPSNRIFAKPFDSREIIAKIEEILGN